LTIGGKGNNFSGKDYPQKGCYTYTSGKYKDRVYFGAGGSAEEMSAPITGDTEKIRPVGYDCVGV